MLIGLEWGPQELFFATAVPAFISTLTIIALMFTMKVPARAGTAQPAPLAH
jgi:hypothetical protein